MTIGNWSNRNSNCYPRNTRLVGESMWLCSRMLYWSMLATLDVTWTIPSKMMPLLTLGLKTVFMRTRCTWWILLPRCSAKLYQTSAKVPPTCHTCLCIHAGEMLSSSHCWNSSTSSNNILWHLPSSRALLLSGKMPLNYDLPVKKVAQTVCSSEELHGRSSL